MTTAHSHLTRHGRKPPAADDHRLSAVDGARQRRREMRHGRAVQTTDGDNLLEQILRGVAIIVVTGAVLGGLTSIIAIKFVESILSML
jgi:hypothetical protein